VEGGGGGRWQDPGAAASDQAAVELEGVGVAGGKTRARRRRIERRVGGAWIGEVGAYDAWAQGHGTGAAAV
jgi:hypothetical protein